MTTSQIKLLVELFTDYENLTSKLLFDILKGSNSRVREDLYDKGELVIEAITKENFKQTYLTDLWIDNAFDYVHLEQYQREHAGDLLMSILCSNTLTANDKIKNIKTVYKKIKEHRENKEQKQLAKEEKDKKDFFYGKVLG